MTLKVLIRVADQTLELRRDDEILLRYQVSTSRFGIGAEAGSFKTPLGRFQIGEKIGKDYAACSVFKGRKSIPSELIDWKNDPDLITSRILWLEGLEDANRNTKDRHIYIHGTNREDQIGQKSSHGCIRMRNIEIIELFDLVETGTEVEILA